VLCVIAQRVVSAVGEIGDNGVMLRSAGVAAVLCLLAVTPLPAAAGTVDVVRQRGHLVCGVANDLYGFSWPDVDGRWHGLDVDVCRAVAAAVLGDAEKVKFVPLTAQARLTALQTGEVDLLSRNTTWTLTRDTSAGLNFTVINYYDGQGFMVPKRLGVASAKDLSGATICVQTGTTNELNVADYFRANQMQFKPVTIEKLDEIIAAYLAGRCDAFSTDVSGLAGIRASATPVPADHVILSELISKEPLAPAVRQGDDQWFDIVKWSQYAMIEAEELGVSSANVDEMLGSTDPRVRRFLGVASGTSAPVGVDARWVYAVIKQVGNYGESFERNVGAQSRLGLPRGLNALWLNNGLMYAMPFR
jgi:general L-amino acid transport system substrate-binding protein